MLQLCRVLFAIAFVVALFATESAAMALSLSEKVGLQAAMQRHIDSRTVNGRYLRLDPGTGEANGLYPVNAHPTILQMGENFVLCFDFRDEAGKDVPVDFYMARKGSTYTVFHTAISNRKLLHRLMDSGKVTRAE
jgi:uncharacterized membrane protein